MRLIPLGGALNGQIYRTHSERELTFQINGLPQRVQVCVEGWGALLVEVSPSSQRVFVGNLPCVDFAKVTVEPENGRPYGDIFYGLGCTLAVGQLWQIKHGVRGTVLSIMGCAPISAVNRTSIVRTNL